MVEPDRRALRRELLAWYETRKRDLPFRRTKDPYAVLVAEVILQRTRVAAGVPYYEQFLAAFPTVRDLAAASESDVLRAWEGLGFYGRARNLHRAAKAIVREHGGSVPPTYEALRALPGIGEYTAGAVGSIAFGLPLPAVDGNATRVIARVFRIEEDVSRAAGRKRIVAAAADLVPEERPGTWNQAVMELGATVCLPRAPRCDACPISDECLAFAGGVQTRLPVLPAKSPVPVHRVAFALVEEGEKVLLLRRADGLHGGMYALPGGDVRDGETGEEAVRRHLAALGLRAAGVERVAPVRHAFSHIRWEGAAYHARVRGTPDGAVWTRKADLAGLPVVPIHRQLLEAMGNPARA